MQRTKEQVERDHQGLVDFINEGKKSPGERARDTMRQYNTKANDPDYCARRLIQLLSENHNVSTKIIDNGERNKSKTEFWMQKYIDFEKLPCAQNMKIRPQINDRLTELGKESHGVDRTTLHGYNCDNERNHRDDDYVFSNASYCDKPQPCEKTFNIVMEVHKN